MKTEVMLDDAIAMELQKVAEESHISFGQALQKAVSAGLPSLRSPKKSGPFRIVTHDFGTPLDDPKALLAKLEEEEDLERYRRGGG